MESKQKNIILIILYLMVLLPAVFYGSAVLSEEITDYTALVPGNVYFDQIFLILIGPLIMILLLFLLVIPLSHLFLNYIRQSN